MGQDRRKRSREVGEQVGNWRLKEGSWIGERSNRDRERGRDGEEGTRR